MKKNKIKTISNEIVKISPTLDPEVGVAPSAYPDWAMLDLVDPISGSNNCIEPPPEKKQYGTSYAGVLERNFLNWMFRTISSWIKFLDTRLHTPQSFAKSTKPNAPEVSAGKIIYIQDLGDGGSMAFSDGTNWRKVSDNTIIE